MRAICRQNVAQGRQGPPGVDGIVATLQTRHCTVGVQAPESVETDEGVATRVVAQSGALEQAESSPASESLVDRNRRITIELQRLGEGDRVVAVTDDGI